MRGALALLLVLALAACQPLPQPFRAAPDQRSALALPVSAPGVAVFPVPGLPGDAGARLTLAMAEALRQRDVAIITQGRISRATFRLRSAAQATPLSASETEIGVAWRLEAADGTILAEHRQLETVAPDGAWHAAIAAAAADVLVRALRDPSAHASLAVEERASVAVSVDGAPGDGADALPRAVMAVLSLRGVTAVPLAAAPNAPIRIAIRIDTQPVDRGRLRVVLAWSVARGDGRTVGTLRQENVIPAGLIERRWGDTALTVAEAALDDLVALIDRAR